MRWLQRQNIDAAMLTGRKPLTRAARQAQPGGERRAEKRYARVQIVLALRAIVCAATRVIES
jgi:hypothetical protein